MREFFHYTYIQREWHGLVISYNNNHNTCLLGIYSLKSEKYQPLYDIAMILGWIHSHLTTLLVNRVLWESKLIYWLLPGVMGHLHIITWAEWYFIAPKSPVNQIKPDLPDFLLFENTQFGQIFANCSKSSQLHPESVRQVHWIGKLVTIGINSTKHLQNGFSHQGMELE